MKSTRKCLLCTQNGSKYQVGLGKWWEEQVKMRWCLVSYKVYMLLLHTNWNKKHWGFIFIVLLANVPLAQSTISLVSKKKKKKNGAIYTKQSLAHGWLTICSRIFIANVFAVAEIPAPTWMPINGRVNEYTEYNPKWDIIHQSKHMNYNDNM